MDPLECFSSCLSCDNFSNVQGVTFDMKNRKFHKVSCLAGNLSGIYFDKWIFRCLTRLVANFIYHNNSQIFPITVNAKKETKML